MSAVLGMGMMAGCVAELIDECDRVCLMSVCGLGQPLSVSLYVSSPPVSVLFIFIIHPQSKLFRIRPLTFYQNFAAFYIKNFAIVSSTCSKFVMLY